MSAATLPFTGAAMPIKTATLIGAGLIATGAAAVTASRLREQPAPASTDPEVPDGPPPGPKHAAR